ncbi:MAG: hypothetical protein ACYTG1_03815 [Planctomycetota bacterium]
MGRSSSARRAPPGPRSARGPAVRADEPADLGELVLDVLPVGERLGARDRIVDVLAVLAGWGACP